MRRAHRDATVVPTTWVSFSAAFIVVVLLAGRATVARAEEEEEDTSWLSASSESSSSPEGYQLPLFHTVDPELLSTYSPPRSLNQTSFVVLSAPRSASTSFIHILDRHPSIQCDGELFSRGHISGRLADEWTVERRNANRTAFMRDVFERTRWPSQPDVSARGFKIFSYQLAEPELLRLTQPRHVLKIVLRRQDTIAEFVSQMRMAETSSSGRPQAEAALARSIAETVKIDWDVYQRWLAQQEAWYGWCAREAQAHPESWLFISTEQLVTNPYTMANVYAHLGVRPASTMKYDPYVDVPLQEKISNWDEVKYRIAAARIMDEPNKW